MIEQLSFTWRDLEPNAKDSELPLRTDVLGPFHESGKILDRLWDVSHTESLGRRLKQRVLGLGCSGGLHATRASQRRTQLQSGAS